MMKNQGVVLTIGISCLIFGIIIAYLAIAYIPGKERAIQKKYANQYATEKVFLVENELGLSSNTQVTEELFTEQTIKEVDVPLTFLPKDKDGNVLVYTANDKGSMLGKRTIKTLYQGDFITKKAIEDVGYPDDEQFKRRKEYSLANDVAGEVKTGSLVDVVVNYLNGDYDVVVAKTKVQKLVAADATQSKNNKTGTITVILSVDETQFRDLELAQKVGSLQARVYDDEEQIASLETFKYAEVKSVITSIARNYNLTGDIENYGATQYLGFLGDKTDISEKLKARLAYYKEQLELNKLNSTNTTTTAATPTTTTTTVTPDITTQPVTSVVTPVQ